MGKNWVWVVREMRVEIPGYTEVEYVAQCESKSQARDVIREKEAQNPERRVYIYDVVRKEAR